MSELVLINNKNIVLKYGTDKVIKELMTIIDIVGCVPAVTYNGNSDTTILEFEGMYNNFNLYIKNK